MNNFWVFISKFEYSCFI